MEKCEGFFEPEYFLFDFSGDDQEDYLVSLAGSGFGGSGGNSVYIFLEGDVLKEVFWELYGLLIMGRIVDMPRLWY